MKNILLLILMPSPCAIAQNAVTINLCLAKTSYSCKMNDLAQSSIRIFPLQFLP
jgi:hypothetical protein